MQDVSTTAKLCSFARAHHSMYGRRKIFDDYLAFDLMGSDAYHDMESLIECTGSQDCPLDADAPDTVDCWLNKYLSPILLARASFAERALQTFAEQHETCQYVMCGAGLDTFTFRNGNQGIKVFELDHPFTQDYKMQRIARLNWTLPQSAHFVPIDFSTECIPGKLLGAGFDPSLPSFFSILGVTYYLQLPVFAQTVASAASLMPPESQLVFDFPDATLNQDGGRSNSLAAFTANLGEPMAHGYDYGSVSSTLAQLNLNITTHLTPQRIQALFFDGRNDGQTAYESVHFIKAQKKGTLS